MVEGARVAAADRLDSPGSLPQVLRAYYDRLSLVTAARGGGLAQAGYEYARAYAEERQAFGKPIGHFQAVAFLLADMAAAVDAARWLVWRAAWEFDQGLEPTANIAIAQAQALEAAFFCANSAVQVLGGGPDTCRTTRSRSGCATRRRSRSTSCTLRPRRRPSSPPSWAEASRPPTSFRFLRCIRRCAETRARP